MERRLGAYTLREELWAGRTGELYLATDANGQRVALRVLPPQLMKDERSRKRFLQVVTAALKLKHPNIAAALDTGHVSGRFFLAMELVSGENLRSRLRRGERFEPVEALRITAALSEALIAIHAAGLVHRDLRPGKIVFTTEGVPKITDVASVRSAGGDSGSVADSGDQPGLAAYVSPEQMRGERDLDIRCDIYAVGGILYEMLTQVPATTVGSVGARLEAHDRRQAPDPGELEVDLTLGVRRLVMDLMAGKREERIPDPTTLRDRVRLLRSKRAVSDLAASEGEHPPFTLRWRAAADGPAQTFVLRQPRPVLGSQAGCEVVIPEPAHVQAAHAEVLRAAGTLHIRRLEGATFVNGHAADQPVPLRKGDRIQLGEGGPELIFLPGESVAPTGVGAATRRLLKSVFGRFGASES